MILILYLGVVYVLTFKMLLGGQNHITQYGLKMILFKNKEIVLVDDASMIFLK